MAKKHNNELNANTQSNNINIQKTLQYIMSALTTFFNFIEEKPMTKLSSLSKMEIKKISISDTISSIKSDESEDIENSERNSYAEISNSDIFISKK